MSDKASGTRARQACEPCRRKKTKCPGEKPTCSFCQRLGQRCSYEKGEGTSSRIEKSHRAASHDGTGSRDRLQRLESRVEEVFDILSDFASRAATQQLSAPQTSAQTIDGTVRQSTTPVQDSQSIDSATRLVKFDSVQRQEPPDDLWPELIDIYKKKFDDQPLCVLGPRLLAITPRKWSRCLRWSFLSLTVPFLNSHSFYDGCQVHAISFYTNSARSEIFNNVAESQISAAVLQASCLFALKEITGSNPLGAWMTIGIGIRLALITSVISNTHNPKILLDREDRSRCAWSLFALDRLYGSTLTIPPALSTEDIFPPFPDSAPSPNHPNNSPPQANSIHDLGVTANYFRLLSIWGNAMKYVQSVKDGKMENAWSAKSQYYEVVARLHDFETNFAQIHRFQQAGFQERSIETLEAQRSYWAPWLLGQFLFHAIQGLINHPFLHIALRTKQQVFPPPSFQQNSVDQAVLHSAWILKCIEVSTETGFGINDPFAAHLAAITATIYLFLLNAKDEDLAAQARMGFESCYTFIQCMSETWPHLRHTIDKLDILQQAAISISSAAANRSAPKAQGSLLWELLDYSASTIPSQIPEFASDAVDLNVNTRFLSALNPLSSGHSPSTVGHHSASQPHLSQRGQAFPEPVWDPSMDSLGFNLFDNEQMADLTNLTFGRDLWTFGQL